MSQGFVFGTPANTSDLESLKIRVNIDAIATANAGIAAPAAPREGMFWLDTAQAPTQFLLKQFLSSSFKTLITFPPASGVAAVALFTISPAVTTWTLVHNLNKAAVVVALYDLNKKLIEALDVDVTNVNQVVVTHAFAITGTAVVVG